MVTAETISRCIAGKFETLGVLQRLGIVAPAAQRPVVGRLEHGITDLGEATAFAGQGPQRRHNSIQACMSRQLRAEHSFDVLLDDDHAGEAADLVSIAIRGTELHVTLVHCKYSSDDHAGAREADLYELFGQAMRGAKWRHQGAVGTIQDLYRIRELAPQLRPRFHTVLAQPGLPAAAATDEQLRLIAGAANYVRAVTRGTFDVRCSP